MMNISPKTFELQREIIKKVYTRVQEIKEIRQDFATAVTRDRRSESEKITISSRMI